MAAMLRLAAANGADIRFGTPVTRLEPTPAGDGAVAHTDSGTFSAPVIAVAAGAWIAPLLDGVVELPPLTVTQQQVLHFAPVQLRDSGPGRAVADLRLPGRRRHCYGLPGGRDGEVPGAIKIGEHRDGSPGDNRAADRDFMVDPAARARITDFVGRRLPGLNRPPRSTR